MQITRVGVDIAKSVFHVHGVDRHGHHQWQARYKRRRWLEAVCERVPAGAEIGMEACGAAHHWGVSCSAAATASSSSPRNSSNPTSRATKTIVSTPRRSARP